MSCSTITSILKGCDNNQGGIQAVYINSQDNVTIPVTVDNATWTVTSVTVADPFIPFEFNRNTGNYTEEEIGRAHV